jgi:hypothetical protein
MKANKVMRCLHADHTCSHWIRHNELREIEGFGLGHALKYIRTKSMLVDKIYNACTRVYHIHSLVCVIRIITEQFLYKWHLRKASHPSESHWARVVDSLASA